jgi:hypothetical protein
VYVDLLSFPSLPVLCCLFVLCARALLRLPRGVAVVCQPVFCWRSFCPAPPVPQTRPQTRPRDNSRCSFPLTSHARHVKGTLSPFMLLATNVHTRRTLFIAPVDLSLWVGAFWCQASQCCWCGKDCRSSYSRRRIHRACNIERIEEQRNGGSHVKKERWEDAPTRLLAAAAAAIASTPPMTDPTA